MTSTPACEPSPVYPVSINFAGDFERASGSILGFRNERLQVFAQPPNDVEPAVAVGKSICHSRLALIACDVEPRRPTLDQLLLKITAHDGEAHSGNSI